MTTYVLVHGAWGGAHGFRHVRRLLHGAGHEVFTPSLTGVGERAHLTGPQVGLSTHVLDVVNTVLYEDLDEIVLVGYSYGGFVVTGCLDHIGERVAHLVFVDAFVPHDGETLVGLVGGPPPGQITIGQDWLVPSAAAGLRRPRRGGLRRRPPDAPAVALLHRAGAPRSSARGVPVHEDLHQGHRRRARRAGRWRVLGRRRPRPSVAGVALPGDRHQPHDPEQPTRRAGRPPARGDRRRRDVTRGSPPRGNRPHYPRP